MTTYARGPLDLDDTRISRDRARGPEIASTLVDRFALPDRQRPGSLREVVDLVQDAIDQGRRLRVLGAARGLSVASDPIGPVPVSTENLRRIYKRFGRDIKGLRRRRGVSSRSIVRLQAGVPARAALRALLSEDPPRTLINHGSGDFQSIVGAISTGTHGTGPYPSLAGLVRAIVVVRVAEEGGQHVPRVELIQRNPRATGPQAPCYVIPQKGTWIAAKGVVVHSVADDDAFFAHVVGLGCLGFVYSVTLDVSEQVPLMEESRTPERLDRILKTCRDDYHDKGLRLEVIVDPYPRDTNDGDDPKKWDEVVPLPPTQDFAAFRGQLVRRTESDDEGPRGNLPFSMREGSKPYAAGLIGARIGDLIEDPARKMPKGANAMIECSSLRSYVDWLPDVLLLNLKYTGIGSEWNVPWENLENALWAIFEEASETYEAYQAKSDAKGRWIGEEEELVDLLEERTPFYNGPSVRFVEGEGALLAGTHREGRSGEVPIWTAIEIGFLGRPDVEEDWLFRKRWAGLRPEQPVPRKMVEALFSKLDADDAKSPGGAGLWLTPKDLPRVHSRVKRRRMRLFAAYERGRIVTLNRLTERLCTDRSIAARPHQGLHHDMTWEQVEAWWGKAAQRWRERFHEVNPIGTFDNALTEQWDLRGGASAGPSA